MESANQLTSFQQKASYALVTLTRVILQLCSQDIGFHCACNENIDSSLKLQYARLLLLTNRLLNNRNHRAECYKLGLKNTESIDLNWHSMVENTDNLLEEVDKLIDELAGVFQRGGRVKAFQDLDQKTKEDSKANPIRASFIVRPQLSFEYPPANHEVSPFKPLLSSKPHSSVPLPQCLVPAKNSSGKFQYPHPYEDEIKQYEYPPSVYTWKEPIAYQDFETTTATFVDSMEGVLSMLDDLKRASEIAVDVEHHDTHSYLGIVCLIQISTRESDWVIDTLKPWRRELEVLNEVFANPHILKIFHGAQMDVLWLQRDLGIYVVGLFDTYHASRILCFSSASLAFLLKKFVNFDAQKQYQTADWRLRPIPESMFNYARSDTHFLLYIFDHIRNELKRTPELEIMRRDKVLQILAKSKETALQRYEYPFHDYECGSGRGGYLSLLQKTSLNLDRQSLTIFRRVHEWRDNVARVEDENLTQIMPNHTIFNIAKAKPTTLPSLLTVSHPLSASVRQRTSDLLNIIKRAIESSESEPDLDQLLSKAVLFDQALSSPSFSSLKFLHNSHADTIEPKMLGASRLELSSFWGSLFT